MKPFYHLLLAITVCVLMVAAIGTVKVLSHRKDQGKELACTDRIFKLYMALKGYEARFGHLPFGEDNWRVALAQFELLPNANPNDQTLRIWTESLHTCSHIAHRSEADKIYTAYFLVKDEDEKGDSWDDWRTSGGADDPCNGMFIELPEHAKPIESADDLTLSNIEDMCSNGMFPMHDSYNRGILFADGTIVRQIKPIPFQQFRRLFDKAYDVKAVRTELIEQGYLKKVVSF